MTTIYLPLEESLPFPATPGFLAPSSEPSEHVRKVIKNILKARRIAVVCGAGISVQAGIPDFRSSEGLFQTMKKDNPTLSSGKDLFDASVFNSESTTSLFCQMIAQLSELSKSASPTAFHLLLRALDDRGRLLRVYTQNIDALESRAGLTFGVPEADSGRRFKPRSSKGNTNSRSSHITSEALNGDAYTQSEPIASTSRLPSPPVETPRCIPLHGTLQHMYCQVCQRSFPLSDYLDSLTLGSPPYCPECTEIEATRQLVGKRSRGVGKLRPSVVLYNEAHRDGEEVGEVVRRDLCGGRSKGVGKGKGKAGGADLLLVVGTSLRVPGTKRIVREFSKAVRSRASYASSSGANSTTPSSSQESNTSASTSGDVGLATPVPSPRRTPSVDDDPPVRVIYLNLDFPVPTREWEGVFDVWIRGDAQQFAELVHEEMRAEERLREEKEEKRKRREEERCEREKLKALKEEEDRRKKEEKERQQKAKKKGKKGKEIKEGVKNAGAKKRKAGESGGSPPKRHKGLLTPPSSQSSSTAAKQSNSKNKKLTKSASLSRLTIKIPPRYSFITPPDSEGHWVPEVVIDSNPRQGSTIGQAPLSPPGSPLTPLPLSSPPMTANPRPSLGRRTSSLSSLTSTSSMETIDDIPTQYDREDPACYDPLDEDNALYSRHLEEEEIDILSLDGLDQRFPDSFERTVPHFGA